MQWDMYFFSTWGPTLRPWTPPYIKGFGNGPDFQEKKEKPNNNTTIKKYPDPT